MRAIAWAWPGESARPCGCDPGASHVCEACQQKANDAHKTESVQDGPVIVRGAPRRLTDADRRCLAESGMDREAVKQEIRVVDAKTGGEKGSKLARFSLIPPEFVWALAEHYGRGARKYADRNWERGYKWSLSLDALERHLTQWKRGEVYDAETGSHHLIAVAWHACALFIFSTRRLGTNDIHSEEKAA